MRGRLGARLLFASAGLVLAGCHSVSLATDPTSGSRADTSPEALFHLDWWVRLVDKPMLEYIPRETATPAVDPETERVVVSTRDGRVRSLSPEDGKTEWEFKTHGAFSAGALVQDGTAYVPGGDGTLYALKAHTGELAWSYPTGEELATTPVLSDGKLLVASQGDTLYAVEATTGKWLWQYRRDPPSGFTVRGTSAPRVEAGVAYLGFSDGYLVAVNVADGTVKWERALSSGGTQFLDVDATPAFDESGRLYVASYKDGVYALNAGTGEPIWHTARAGISSVLPMGEAVFVAGDAQVGALSTQDGRSLWTLNLAESAGRQPLFIKGMLVVPTNGSLMFVDPVTGRPRTSWDPGNGVSATPARANSRIYVLSNNGLVYAMRLRGSGG